MPKVYVDGTLESTASPFTMQLLSGTHLIEDTAGHTVTFTVNLDGTITFPSSEDSKLSVKGSTLTILSLS